MKNEIEIKCENAIKNLIAERIIVAIMAGYLALIMYVILTF